MDAPSITDPTITPLRRLLESGLRISIGCTEPVAIALATAYAARLARGDAAPDPDAIEHIEIALLRGVYKNALAVPIPNSGGRCGVRVAAGLGVCCDPERGLRLLETVSKADVEAAERLIAHDRIVAKVLEEPEGDILVDASVRVAGHLGRAVLGGGHDQLIRLERDGTARPLPNRREQSRESLPEGTTLGDLVRLVEGADFRDLALIEEGVRINREAMEAGERLGDVGVGAALRRACSSNRTQVAAATAAAVDARMTGVPIPVMTSCGSGNQGILALLPIALYAERADIAHERAIRAIALSHLVNQYASDRLGLVSPLCGLFVKSGLGATAGFCYLLGGDEHAVDRAVRLMLASHAGTVCDGAGPGCAMKVAAAVEAALRSAIMGLEGFPIRTGTRRREHERRNGHCVRGGVLLEHGGGGRGPLRAASDRSGGRDRLPQADPERVSRLSG